MVDVDCGTEWIVYNDNSDVFSTDATSNSLTVSAGQNLVKSERTGTIYLMTRWYRIIFATITVTQDAYGSPEITVDTKECHFPAVGELSTEIAVEANGEWTAESDVNWLTIGKTEAGITLTVAQNPETTERTAEVVLTCADDINSASETIKVSQDAHAYINLGEEVLFLSQLGDVVSVAVESNFDWECTDIVDWLTIEKNENGESLKITYTTNETGVNRDCTITVTAGDGAENFSEANLNITQVAYSITVDTNEWYAPAVGELSKVIVVEASADWTAETEADWLTVEKTESCTIITAKENIETSERTGKIVLDYINVLNSASETITVTQDAAAYITLSEEELIVYAYEYTSTVSIESNYDWDYTYNSDWLTVESDEYNKSISITYLANEDISDRSTVLTITAGDGVKNVAEVELRVTQRGYDPEKSLILEYDFTNTTPPTIWLPLTSVKYALIDWGDGEQETTFSSRNTHTYSNGGIYTVSVNGEAGHMYSYATDTAYSGAKNLTAVVQWGDLGLTDMSKGLYGCTNLVSLPDEPGLFSNVTSFRLCFYNCSSLTTVPENMFSGCTFAKDFYGCFYGCSKLTSAPSFEGCSAATDFAECFYKCIKLTSAPSFKGCSVVTTFYHTFIDCSVLTTVPEDMFSGCTSAKEFSYCFSGCKNLTSAPSFEGCFAATTFICTFENCSALRTVPENMFLGCTLAYNFNRCFYFCSSLTSLPENMFSGCTLAYNFNSCFYYCSSVEGESPYTEINVDGETVKVHLYERENYPDYFTVPTNYSICFYGCRGLTDYSDIPSGWK